MPHVKKGGGLAVKAKRGKAEEVSDCTTAEDVEGVQRRATCGLNRLLDAGLSDWGTTPRTVAVWRLRE